MRHCPGWGRETQLGVSSKHTHVCPSSILLLFYCSNVFCCVALGELHTLSESHLTKTRQLLTRLVNVRQVELCTSPQDFPHDTEGHLPQRCLLFSLTSMLYPYGLYFAIRPQHPPLSWTHCNLCGAILLSDLPRGLTNVVSIELRLGLRKGRTLV